MAAFCPIEILRYRLLTGREPSFLCALQYEGGDLKDEAV
jgi:hypothetical protein